MGRRSSPTTTTIYDRGDTFDRYTGEDLDNTGPSTSVQNFMAAMGDYFDRLNVSKDIRETTTAFVLGLQGMERNLFEVGIRQVLEQLDAGEENIKNPLNEGFIGGLGYLENFAPSLYDYFNDMFGDNETLSRSEVEDSFGISKEDPETDQETTTTVEETIGDEDYTTDLLPVPDLTPDGGKVEVTDVGGTELTGVDDTTESTYTLPENEPVDVTELTEEQQTSIWDKIKEGLGKIPEAIEKVIFGPDGIPSNVDEWIEWVDETLQAQMGPENIPFPIVITTNPQEGTWIDLKIPVDFDVNGTPIRIPLLDEDGNFVSSEELGKAWVDAKGQIFGPLGEIGEIFLDKDGNPTLDLGELKNVLLKDLTLNPDGSITGSTAGEILVGEWFFNSDTQEWEKEEVADINEDTVDNDTTDDDELKGLDEDPDEDPTPSAKPPRGNLITDKDGNPIRIIGEDGTNYVLDEDGQWVAAVVGEGEEGETVLQGTTTTIENNEEVVTNDDDEQVLTEAPELSEAPTFSNQDSTRVVEPPFQPEEPIIDTEDSGSVQVLTEAPVLPEVPVFSNQDSTRVVEPPFIPPDDPLVGTTDDPIVIPPDDPLVGTTDDPIVIPPDDPLVGTTDDPIVIPPDDPLVGTTPLTGGGGGGGRSLESGGYMGGLSYVLPEFVGVQYQPKNYNAALDRIINESLFKGMI